MKTRADEQAIQGLLTFWFDEDTKKRWYDATSVFDEICEQRFGMLAGQGAEGALDHWRTSAEGALALCLLLDQLPRNIHRGTPKAFTADPKAVAVARAAIEQGFDQNLDTERRKFFYLPFMHSEELAAQERSVELCTALGDENILLYAREHADVIQRFGRFPHRNAILGRASTEAEQAFLEAGAKTYGQSTDKG